MASYQSPGVYIKDMPSGIASIEQASSSIGMLIGTAKSGVINEAQKIGSWAEYVQKYANGLESPFDPNDFLAYEVYGFFQNGGQDLYVASVKKNAVKATATTGGFKATAKYEGAWGNDVSIAVKKNVDYSEEDKSFDVTVSIGSSDSTTISDVTVDTIESKVNENAKVSDWLEEFTFDKSTEGGLSEVEFKLAKGSDGDSLGDSDYIKALSLADTLDDVTMIGIPGQTSKVINDGILSYCDNNGLFPVLDAPMGSTPKEVKELRKGMSAWTGAFAYPWIKVNDPDTNTLKRVPTCGYLMGVYARTIEERGVFKAPAGIEAVVRGAIEMEYTLTESDIRTLNPIGVICITPRPNAGIVIWGARSLNSTDSMMRYVSDGLLNLNIKRSLYQGTQFAVFEPNDEHLWSRVRTSCKAFLETLRSEGALKGTASQAYYVTCDETNNPDNLINQGQLNIEIGYAPVKPAEFVIIKLAHSIVSSEE